MSCSKSLTIGPASISTETPFDAAVYVPSVAKIFATMGPYVCKCNSTTGAIESTARVSSPLEGPCGITYHAATGFVYVSGWNGSSGIYYTLQRLERDIFPVNPTTMAVGVGLGIYALCGDAISADTSQGPMELKSNGGSYIYFTWLAEGSGTGTFMKRVNPANLGGFAGYELLGYGDSPNAWIQFGLRVAANDTIYYMLASAHRVAFDELVGVDSGTLNYTADSATVLPTAVEYCNADTNTYCVGGNANLLKITSYGPDAYSVIDMSAVFGASNPTPVHIRYNSVDGKLYIPCPASNQVLIYEPIGATWEVKTGFDSPFDAVFTPTKSFAVQKGPVGLMEIV